MGSQRVTTSALRRGPRRINARVGACGDPPAALVVLVLACKIPSTACKMQGFCREECVPRRREGCVERDKDQCGCRASRREPEHAALLGASLRVPRAAPQRRAAIASTSSASSRRCGARCSRRTTSRPRSRSPASAARAPAPRTACSRRSTASTTRSPTASSRRACRSARSSGPSRSCCCPPSTSPTTARAARPSTSSRCRWATGWLHAQRRVVPPATRSEGVLLFDSSRGARRRGLHVQALELALRRAGFRVLLLSVALAQERVDARDARARPHRARAVRLGRDARRGRAGSSTRCARWARGPALRVPRSMPVSGSHSVPSLGELPTDAVRHLRARVEAVRARPAVARCLVASGPRAPLRACRSRPVVPRARGAGPRALARARRLPRVDPPPRGRRAVRLLRGSAHRQRPARVPPRALARVQGRVPALQDDARPPRPPQGRLGLPRAARSSSRSSASWASSRRRTSSATASPSSTRSAAQSVLTYIDEWNQLTERIGFWIDTDARLLHARRTTTSSRSGGRSARCGRRACSTRATRSCRTARAAGPRCPRTRSRRATRTWSTLRCSCASRCVGEEGVSLLGWTTTPWTLLSNAALAVHPDVTYVRARVGDEVLILAEALAERVLGEGTRSSVAHEGLGAGRHSLQAAVRLTSPTSASVAIRCSRPTS